MADTANTRKQPHASKATAVRLRPPRREMSLATAILACAAGIVIVAGFIVCFAFGVTQLIHLLFG